MCGLGHYLEEEGLPTTLISLVRPHTEAIKPPRALWVPFVLGRPLGNPDDLEFQKRVLHNVLGLLERPASDAPVLVDHDEEAEAGVDTDDGLSCPLSFSPVEGDGSLRERLAEEISGLHTWHGLAVERTGRTSFGLAGLTIDEVVDTMMRAADGEVVKAPEGESVGNFLRFVVEDLKAYVTEAAAAQPGDLSAFAMRAWFWEQTVAGEAVMAVYQAGLASDDETWKGYTATYVPRDYR